MFTGIIETMARLERVERKQNNIRFTFSSSITPELKVDQSISHNGACLTVEEITGKMYSVTAIGETLEKTNLAELSLGEKVNIERCMAANGRFDGHIVQGHVDTVGVCREILDKDGSFEYVFEHPTGQNFVTVEKGSITVNGVSLTVVSSSEGSFSVHIIPYTLNNTGFKQLKPGSKVNLEFDIVGKYVARLMKLT